MPDVAPSVLPMFESFLNKDVYMVITGPVRSPEIEKLKGEHLQFQLDMEKRGILFAAGPIFERGSSVPETGMYVLRASSFEEAEALANSDPLHKAGLRKYTLQKWRINEGSFTVTIKYSDQSAHIE